MKETNSDISSAKLKRALFDAQFRTYSEDSSLDAGADTASAARQPIIRNHVTI
jgi:hypothetical protein